MEMGARSPLADPRRVAGVLGSLLVLVGTLLPWLESPLRGRVPHGFVSFAILLGILGLIVSCLRRFNRFLIVVAVGVFALCGFAVVHLAVEDPILWSFEDDDAQHAAVVRFTMKHLIWNLGPDPQFQRNLPTDTVTDRLSEALYFMARGWWFGLAGGVAMLIGCAGAGAKEVLRFGALSGAVALGVVTIILFRPLVAEARATRADRLMAQGRFQEAIDGYETVRMASPQAARNERIWLRIGEAYYRLNRMSDPRARFYVAECDTLALDLDKAIAEYELLVQSAPEPLLSIARRKLAWRYTEKGSALYDAGSPAAAVKWWEKALSVDPAQVQAEYFLSRGYYDTARYDMSIGMGRLVLSQAARDTRIQADVLCNIGDSFTRLHQFAPAREAYALSFKLDPDLNYRALRSLDGT
jgi:tetratricopeptide (TPR) repeat protein